MESRHIGTVALAFLNRVTVISSKDMSRRTHTGYEHALRVLASHVGVLRACSVLRVSACVQRKCSAECLREACIQRAWSVCAAVCSVCSVCTACVRCVCSACIQHCAVCVK